MTHNNSSCVILYFLSVQLVPDGVLTVMSWPTIQTLSASLRIAPPSPAATSHIITNVIASTRSLAAAKRQGVVGVHGKITVHFKLW